MHVKPELTPRLQLLADWVPQGARLADIGTDHGYLPIWLLQHERISYAIASDLRSGPLSHARASVAKYHLEDRMDLRLCDGLSGIQPGEADLFVIAGMGGETIASILDSTSWIADGTYRLLLQPMTRAEVLRGYLEKHEWRISKEQLVLDRGTIYPVMQVERGTMRLTQGQRYGGAALERDALEGSNLNELIIRQMNAINGRKHAVSLDELARTEQLRNLVLSLLEMKEAWRCANSREN